LLFKSLNLSAIQDKNYYLGHTGYSRHAMIKAFIVKHLKGIKAVSALLTLIPL
jgi:hypothetical protein